MIYIELTNGTILEHYDLPYSVIVDSKILQIWGEGEKWEGKVFDTPFDAKFGDKYYYYYLSGRI